MHRLSTFPKRVAFAYFVEARPPQFLTRLRLGSLRATARGLAAVDLPADNILAPLLLDTSRCHAGSRATLSLSLYRGGLLSSHKERAASRRTQSSAKPSSSSCIHTRFSLERIRALDTLRVTLAIAPHKTPQACWLATREYKLLIGLVGVASAVGRVYQCNPKYGSHRTPSAGIARGRLPFGTVLILSLPQHKPGRRVKTLPAFRPPCAGSAAAGSCRSSRLVAVPSRPR